MLASRFARPIAQLTAFITLTMSAFIAPAWGQNADTVAKAFTGRWVSYDRAFSFDSRCILEFSSAQTNGIYPITTKNCANEAALITGWKIENNQLIFVDKSGSKVALVGGDQSRLSGTVSGSNRPIIIERFEIAERIQKARKAIACSYVGYSPTCATPKQFAPPALGSGTQSNLKILVNLNARIEPRSNAKVVSVLKPDSCLKATACSMTSDGLWCKVILGGSSGWIKKQAVRQKKWPVITFENGC